MKCLVVTPERAVAEREASFVAVPLFDGELGVLPGHTPMVGRLGAGELRIHIATEKTTAKTVESYYVAGGFVEVSGDVVSVMTMRACPAAALRRDEATQQLDAALASQHNVTPELADTVARNITEARAQLRVATKVVKNKV